MLFALSRSHRLETSLHMLVEHLDSALGVGEALMACSYEPPEIGAATTPVQILDALEELRAFIEDVRGLEMALCTKVRQARHWGQRLGRLDQRCGTAGRLYHAGTQAFVDAMPAMADRTGEVFENGDQALVYLKDRNLIGADQMSLDGIRQLAVGPGFLVCGWAPLGDLMDLTGRFVSSVETEHFVAEAGDSVTTGPLPRDTAASAPLLPVAELRKPEAAGAVEAAPEATTEVDDMAPWLPGQQAVAAEPSTAVACKATDETAEAGAGVETVKASESVEAEAAEEDDGAEELDDAAVAYRADGSPESDEDGDDDADEVPLEQAAAEIAAADASTDDGDVGEAAVSLDDREEDDAAGGITVADPGADAGDDEGPDVVEPMEGNTESQDAKSDADEGEPDEDEADLAAPVPVMTKHPADSSLEKL